jgi:uncharacterized protein (DUF433 family)
MTLGLERLATLPLSLRLLDEIRRELLRGARGGERTPGEFRRSQNWIGPAGCTLADASFVPPPPTKAKAAMGDQAVNPPALPPRRLPPLGTLEPREVPSYRIAEAAQYLRMPKATVRAWALGQGSFRPVLDLETVVIDPEVQFGRPVLVGTGIPTLVIADRYKAGESIAELARDYDRAEEEIQEAIRCELPLASAA